MEVIRTERIWIKPTSEIDRLCQLSNNLYNEGNYIIRNSMNNGAGYIGYNDLDEILKYGGYIFFFRQKSKNYVELPAQSAQQTLKILDRDWRSFFENIKEWKRSPDKFKAKPEIPRFKKKHGKNIVIFTNQQCKIKNGMLIFPPKSTNIKPIKTRLPDNTNIREVRIIPKSSRCICEIVYIKEIEPNYNLDYNRWFGIDLGVRIPVMIVSNFGMNPIAIKDGGKGIKSTIQYYNKEMARVQSIYENQKIRNGNKRRRLNEKKSKKVNDWCHKVSKYIIDLAVKNKVGNIAIGKNDGWKQEVKLGRRINQQFVQIPHSILIEKIKYKAEECSIKVVVIREDYTSKCSFLDDEEICKHDKDKYMGVRKGRLFESSDGTIIHSDVNGAYNIMKKATIELRRGRLEGGCGLHPSVKFIS